MTDRPRILDLPGGPVIANAWTLTGYGDAIPLVDAYLGIDTDALKRTALNLYGILLSTTTQERPPTLAMSTPTSKSKAAAEVTGN